MALNWIDVVAILTLIIGGGGLLFYRQRLMKLEIENASAMASEWEKLYREQKKEREDNDAEISALKKEVTTLRAEVASIRPYICYDLTCKNRITRIKKNEKNEKDS